MESKPRTEAPARPYTFIDTVSGHSRTRGKVVSFRTPIIVALVVAAAALLPGAAVSGEMQKNRLAAQNELVATVGPNFTITLRTQAGQGVSQLDPGAYTITVSDRSIEHNFHLQGPGVNQSTLVETEGTVTWNVTFTDGRYTYVCDPHANQMRGSFTVGNVQPPPPPPLKRLTASVGPGFSISLKTTAGKRAARVAAGRYRITVRDRSANHNFHLVGPGVNKKTSVRFRGTRTWTVRFQKGKRYRFRCDPHAARMKGRLRAT
jgi:plastocyanin